MYNLFLILAVLIDGFPRWYPSIRLWEGRQLFFIAEALAFVLFAIADYYKPKILTRWNRMFYRITLWFMVSNLMDELFFDPIHFGLNELIFALFIIVTEIYICYRNGFKRA